MSLDRQPTQKDCDHGRDRVDEGDVAALRSCFLSTEAHCAPPPLKFPEQTAMKRPATSCGGRTACGCHGGVPCFDGLVPRYKRVLWTVIAINGAMFLTAMVAGHLAGSQA